MIEKPEINKLVIVSDGDRGENMLSDVQEKILLNDRKKLLEQIGQRDEIIEWLIEQLEEKHCGWKGKARAYIFANWDLQY